jgi:hypothetical protein
LRRNSKPARFDAAGGRNWLAFAVAVAGALIVVSSFSRA